MYLGDGARLPYGPRPLDDIRRFAGEIAGYLEHQGVKLIVAACNSATAAALRSPASALGSGDRVLAPGSARPCSLRGTVGLLATEATVATAASELVRALDAGVHVVPVACHRLTADRGDDPFGEETTQRFASTRRLSRRRARTRSSSAARTPLIRPIFQRVFGRGVTLVFSAEETARESGRTLARKGIENGDAREGMPLLTTGDPDLFREMGRRFQLPIDAAEHVEVSALQAAA